MLRQKTALYFVLNIISTILGVITISITARFMGPEPLGLVASILAFIALFNIFGDFGFGLAHYKRVSEGKDLAQCIGTYASVNIVLSFLITFVVLAFYLLDKQYSDTPYISKEKEPLFYILLISTFLTNILKIVSITFAAKLEVAKEVIVGIVTKLALSIAKILVAIIGLGVVYLAGANLFSVVVAMIISLILFRKYPIKLPNKEIFKSYLVFAIPVALMGITDLYVNLDKVFISKFVNAKEVAYYTSAYGIVNFFYFFGHSFLNILIPTFSKMDSEGDKAGISGLTLKVERLLSIVVTPMIFYVVFFSDPIRIIVLGNEFEPSSTIMSILSINVLIVILSKPYSIQAIGTNKVKTALFIQLLIGVVNISMNLLLIPESLFGFNLLGLGAIGASIALVIGNLAGMTLYRINAKKISRRSLNYKVFLHSIVAVIIFSTLYFTSRNYFEFNILNLLILSVVGEALFILILVLLKEINKQDLVFVMDIINIKKMRNYIVGEVKNKK